MDSRDHVANIRSLILTAKASDKMHAVIVEGPAGWGKTTAVDQAFTEASIKGFHLGAYSTPLNLFNFLHRHNKQVVVIDDCAGLFSDQSSMAILKAATWPQGGRRILKWGSTSSRAAIEEFEFRGKLIIICNSFPNSADAEAVKSRSFPIRIDVKVEEAKRLLMAAAKDKIWFNDPKLGASVAKFLISRLSENSLSQVSYRTLQMGYELAKHNPQTWQNLLGGMVSSPQEDPKTLVRRLAKEGLKVKDQILHFEQITGLKRRTFFKYRQMLEDSKR